ncbi:Transposase IS4 [Popillia japonica]|uniref:Transposase IS4 n=1 Tax=Popillia japonica TaxID=7064 RepID=A0AAW1LRL6_POPJA
MMKTTKTTTDGEEIQKPEAVCDYNIYMGGVDKTDMLLSSTESVRKTVKWYKKVFFHIVDLCVLNSYAVYKMKNSQHMALLDYQKDLVKSLIAKYKVKSPKASTSRSILGHSPLRLVDRHFPAIYAKRPLTTKPTQKRCVVCSSLKTGAVQIRKRCGFGPSCIAAKSMPVLKGLIALSNIFEFATVDTSHLSDVVPLIDVIACRYVKKRKDNECDTNLKYVPHYNVRQVFTLEQENKLKEYLLTCSKMFYGLPVTECKKVAYEMAVINKVKYPKTLKYKSHIPKEVSGGKFDSKVEKCVMLRHAPTGCRLWNIGKQKVIISRDVEFNEKVFWYNRKIDVVNDDENGENDKENEMEDNYQDTLIDDECESDDTVLGESDRKT